MAHSISSGPEAAFGTPLPTRSLRGQGFKSPPEAPRHRSLPLKGAAPGSLEPPLRLSSPRGWAGRRTGIPLAASSGARAPSFPRPSHPRIRNPTLFPAFPRPGPGRPDSRPRRVEVGRAARCSGKDFERSDPFFTPTPGLRGPDSPVSRAAGGNNLGKSTENSSSPPAPVTPRPLPQGSAPGPSPRLVASGPRGHRPRAAEPPSVPRAAGGGGGRGAPLTLGESIGESEDPNEEAQHAVRPPSARPRLGPGVGEGARGAGWGGGEPRSPPPARPPAPAPAHSHAHAHTHLYTHRSISEGWFPK